MPHSPVGGTFLARPVGTTGPTLFGGCSGRAACPTAPGGQATIRSWRDIPGPACWDNGPYLVVMDVVDGPGILDAQLASHKRGLAKRATNVNSFNDSSPSELICRVR